MTYFSPQTRTGTRLIAIYTKGNKKCAENLGRMNLNGPGQEKKKKRKDYLLVIEYRAREALPIPVGVYTIFMWPNNGVAASI